MLKQYSCEALGTQRHIAYEAGVVYDQMLLKIMQNFETRYSRFLSGSLLSQLNANKILHADQACSDIIAVGHQAYLDTKGIFSPFVGSSLEQLGYDAQYSFQAKAGGGAPEGILSIENNVVSLGPHTSLDFGGYGKGYLIDLLAEEFEKNNVSNWIINGGGDVRFSRTNKQYQKPIGIPHIQKESLLIAERHVSSGALASSSSLLRTRGDHHHLIDPQAGNSTQNTILSTSVFAPTACLADIGATTLAVGGIDRLTVLSEILGIQYLVLLDDNTIRHSPDVSGLTVFAA